MKGRQAESVNVACVGWFMSHIEWKWKETVSLHYIQLVPNASPNSLLEIHPISRHAISANTAAHPAPASHTSPTIELVPMFACRSCDAAAVR